MFKKIVIVEKSKIIREGLSSLILAHGIGKKLVSMEDFSDWSSLLGDKAPDLVIFSLEVARGNADKIRSRYNLEADALLVGIVYQYYSLREISEFFDEVIYITDSEEVFLNKFHNLFKQKSSHSIESNERLTDREKDVLRLLLQGLSNKEVAKQLSISPHTVVTHRKNIIEKTGIRSLSGLAVYAILNNITDMEDLKQ